MDVDEGIRQIRADLWQTRTDTPFPGLRTHAYLWTRPQGNVLFYSPATDADFAVITAMGGIGDQYLSHQDEAGPTLARIAAEFGSRLHAPAAEQARIGRYARVDVPLAARAMDSNGVEVLPTPGHSPGSTCYLVPGAAGRTYLFTGDTIFLGADGSWSTYLAAGVSDPAALASSLHLLATLQPDVVISSACPGRTAVHLFDQRPWADCVAEALAGLPSAS
jgi:glyoxylase-like metal-dependent hydrolase (beta-lactamase superfamily II)